MSLLVEFPEVESDPSLEVPLLDESVELDDELLDALPVLDAAEVVAEVSIPPTPGAASDPVEWDPPPEQGVQVGTAIQEVEPRPPLELPDELPLDPESVAPPGSDPEVGPAPPIATADPLPPQEYSGGSDWPLLTLPPVWQFDKLAAVGVGVVPPPCWPILSAVRFDGNEGLSENLPGRKSSRPQRPADRRDLTDNLAKSHPLQRNCR